MKAKETQTKRQKAENKELKKAFALLKDEATRYSKMSLDAIDKYNGLNAFSSGLKSTLKSKTTSKRWLPRLRPRFN